LGAAQHSRPGALKLQFIVVVAVVVAVAVVDVVVVVMKS
jgi:hypothetical protein